MTQEEGVMSRREKQHKDRGRARSYTRWIVLTGLVAAAGVGALWILRSGDGAAASAEPISRLGTRDFHSLASRPVTRIRCTSATTVGCC